MMRAKHRGRARRWIRHRQSLQDRQLLRAIRPAPLFPVDLARVAGRTIRNLRLLPPHHPLRRNQNRRSRPNNPSLRNRRDTIRRRKIQGLGTIPVRVMDRGAIRRVMIPAMGLATNRRVMIPVTDLATILATARITDPVMDQVTVPATIPAHPQSRQATANQCASRGSAFCWLSDC